MQYLKFLLEGAFLIPVIILLLGINVSQQDVISLFPIEHYDQSVSTWINPGDPNYDKPLLSKKMQEKRMEIFYDHYFGTLSPWNEDYVNKIFQQAAPDDLKTTEKKIIQDFDNTGKAENETGYGENFHPYDEKWITDIESNINLSQFDHLIFNPANRGITVDNLQARALPTHEVHYYNPKRAGQGYPFDNLQMSAVWAGTPVYVIGQSRDHAFLLVLTPDYIGWVKSSGIARVSNDFITVWSKAAKSGLAAITQTKTSLVDNKGIFLLKTYVGSVFPASASLSGINLMVPVADPDRHAIIKYAHVNNHEAAIMPLTATPKHFANIMRTLVGRPYGWGGIYFYNDCSAEMKSLLTPFGIWLPRHSSEQVQVGKMIDLSAATLEQRLSYLMEKGQRFLTLIYIGGHVVMYIGNYSNPNKSGSLMAMTYQNMWGLSPGSADRRAVIGKAVFFPMLLQYPEDINLRSPAAKNFFQVSFLNQLPETDSFDWSRTLKIDFKALMQP